MAKTRRLMQLLILVTIQAVANVAHAGACCGGGSSVANVILGDEKYLFGADFESKQTEQDVSAKGVWRSRSEAERQETLKLHFTTLVSDRLQMGFSPSLSRKARFGDADTHLGDLNLLLAYEALPDWDYHPIRPRGTVYLNTTLPTGRSVYQSESAGFLDASGKGYATLGIGTIFNKRIANWTAIASGEIHHGLPRFAILPSWGYTLNASLSFDLTNWVRGLSLNTGVSHTYQNSFHLEQNQVLETIQSLQVTTPSIGLSVLGLFDPSNSDDPLVIQLAYADQSLIGAPLNTPLGKSLTLGIRKQILR